MAKSFPLSTIIRKSKNFRDLKYNQIYKAPRKEQIVNGKSPRLHSIDMCKKRKQFYKFIHTHGEEFCVQINRKRKDRIEGGFENVMADDILIMPVQFLREGRNVEKKEYSIVEDASDLILNVIEAAVKK